MRFAQHFQQFLAVFRLMSKSLGQSVKPGLLLVARSVFAHGGYSGTFCNVSWVCVEGDLFVVGVRVGMTQLSQQFSFQRFHLLGFLIVDVEAEEMEALE